MPAVAWLAAHDACRARALPAAACCSVCWLLAGWLFSLERLLD
eukprot:COSAG01_NODE_74139_length_226_cov_1.984252_1_plen_42_part_01